ncbi:MAG: glycosyltransferase family 4 protein [Bacteroidaceae bacterium]|nr:glycosyltransferase family 4 protein [Bacteroidaceae bacterium]
MKKIIFVYGNLPAYRKDFFTNLSKELEANGIEMKVFYGYIANKVVKQDDSNNYKTRKFETVKKSLKLLSFSKMVGLPQAIKEEKPDGIIFQFNQTNISQWQVLRYCKKNNIPYAIWGCNYTRADLKGWLSKIRERIYHYIYRNAKILIPYGTLYRDYFINLGIPKERVVVAQNTINVEAIVDNHKEIPAKDSTNRSLKILYVGALAWQKRIETSIDAVAALIDENYNVTFDIVGGGSELERLKSHLSQKSEKAQTGITLHGAKYGEELTDFFLKADVFLMPGTGGLGVNEAMAYELPIISTHGDETVYDLIDGNGYLLQNFGDKDEQMRRLKEFISLSREEKNAMGKKSRSNILSRASLKNMVNSHLNACKKLIEE